MLKKMTKTQRTYGLFSIGVVVGLIIMVVAASMLEIDDADESLGLHGLMICIMFLFGMSLSFISVNFIFTEIQHNRLVSQMIMRHERELEEIRKFYEEDIEVGLEKLRTIDWGKIRDRVHHHELDLRDDKETHGRVLR